MRGCFKNDEELEEDEELEKKEEKKEEEISHLLLRLEGGWRESEDQEPPLIDPSELTPYICIPFAKVT